MKRKPTDTSRSSAGRGFTLIEVLAALAILTMFLVPILGSISRGLHPRHS